MSENEKPNQEVDEETTNMSENEKPNPDETDPFDPLALDLKPDAEHVYVFLKDDKLHVKKTTISHNLILAYCRLTEVRVLFYGATAHLERVDPNIEDFALPDFVRVLDWLRDVNTNRKKRIDALYQQFAILQAQTGVFDP